MRMFLRPPVRQICRKWKRESLTCINYHADSILILALSNWWTQESCNKCWRRYEYRAPLHRYWNPIRRTARLPRIYVACNIYPKSNAKGLDLLLELKILRFKQISICKIFSFARNTPNERPTCFPGSQNSVPQKDLRLRQTGGLRNSSSSGSSQDVRDATSSPRRPASYVHPSQLPQRWE